MTKFKVGDRVRLTGEAWEKHGMREEVYSVKRIVDGAPQIAVNNGRHMGIYRDGMDYSATLVESASSPPEPEMPSLEMLMGTLPDTRKRLREYTDLADGDTVVIGGVALTMTGGYLTNEKGSQMSTGYAIIKDMLVDEVRRKPRTKKRRVYEAMRHPEDDMDDADLVMDGERWRLVEETEVPR